MPVEDSPDNGEAKTITARSAGTAVIETGKCSEHFFPILFGNTGAVVLHIDAAIILIKLTVDFHAAGRVAGCISDQILNRPVQIPRLHVRQRPALGFIVNVCLDDVVRADHLLFVIHPRGEEWTLTTIRSGDDTFENRADLPVAWAGQKDAALEEASGVKGAKFCHNGRFIAVADSREAILQMADIAVKEALAA